MKLILTLLAILTGFAGGDAVRLDAAAPAALGAALVLADASAEQTERTIAHHPIIAAPRRLMAHSLDVAQNILAVPQMLSGLSPRGLRARE